MLRPTTSKTSTAMQLQQSSGRHAQRRFPLVGGISVDACAPTTKVSPWADPIFDVKLRGLFVKGLSFGAIAAELCRLGRKITRNSVIGRSKRLGLPPRPKAGNNTPKPKKKPTFVFGRGLARVAPEKPAADAM